MSVLERLRAAGKERAEREARGEEGDKTGKKSGSTFKSAVGSALKDGGPLADRLRMLKKQQRNEAEAKEAMEKRLAEREKQLAAAERRANELEEVARKAEDLKVERNILAAAVRSLEEELGIEITPTPEKRAKPARSSGWDARPISPPNLGNPKGAKPKGSPNSSKPQTPQSAQSLELRAQSLVSTIRALKEGRAALEASVRRRVEADSDRASETKAANQERARLHDQYAAQLEALREDRDTARNQCTRLEKDVSEKIRHADNVAAQLDATREAVRETERHVDALENELKVVTAERDALRDANEDARARIDFLKTEASAAEEARQDAKEARQLAENAQAHHRELVRELMAREGFGTAAPEAPGSGPATPSMVVLTPMMAPSVPILQPVPPQRRSSRLGPAASRLPEPPTPPPGPLASARGAEMDWGSAGPLSPSAAAVEALRKEMAVEAEAEAAAAKAAAELSRKRAADADAALAAARAVMARACVPSEVTGDDDEHAVTADLMAVVEHLKGALDEESRAAAEARAATQRESVKRRAAEAEIAAANARAPPTPAVVAVPANAGAPAVESGRAEAAAEKAEEALAAVSEIFNLGAADNSAIGDFPGRAVNKREKLLKSALDAVSAALATSKIALEVEQQEKASLAETLAQERELTATAQARRRRDAHANEPAGSSSHQHVDARSAAERELTAKKELDERVAAAIASLSAMAGTGGAAETATEGSGMAFSLQEALRVIQEMQARRLALEGRLAAALSAASGGATGLLGGEGGVPPEPQDVGPADAAVSSLQALFPPKMTDYLIVHVNLALACGNLGQGALVLWGGTVIIIWGTLGRARSDLPAMRYHSKRPPPGPARPYSTCLSHVPNPAIETLTNLHADVWVRSLHSGGRRDRRRAV